MKIAGLWSGHDCSCCILEDGKPIVHAELERYIREKEPKGDSAELLQEILDEEDFSSVDAFAACHPKRLLQGYWTWQDILGTKKPIHFVSHHTAHAAHAFFSSNLEKSLVVTLDGGGVEDEAGQETATTFWMGQGNKLHHLKSLKPHECNIGGLWTRVTRYIFKLQNGWPYGHQAGSVMAMAALGDPQRFLQDFTRMINEDILPASAKPTGQPVGPYVPGKDPVHPYLHRWSLIADNSKQDMYDLAAALQLATEQKVFSLLRNILKYDQTIENLCLAGGVALNSVMVGKLQDQFPQLKEVFVPPVPYDGGLSLGAAQYVWHQILGNPRMQWDDCFPAYLGEDHGSALPYLSSCEQIQYRATSDDEVVDLLTEGKIVAVYRGSSESGRRALGNRSILADPRDFGMKDKINEKVKKRAWYRPFAPSILREEVTQWFERDIDSPYMSHVVKFIPRQGERVPAVLHFDGTGRLQTVTEKHNPWYYSFIKRFQQKTGVPILLDTSYNCAEPIVETPKNAVDCFLSTDIDYLYFVDDGMLVSRK